MAEGTVAAKRDIPIQNIFFMLVYAWDVLDESEALDVSVADTTRLVDLFGLVLNSGTDALIRRGLYRGYTEHREQIPGVRGKLDISGSIKRNSFQYARAVCEFDEFTHDVLHNQIIRSSIRWLLRSSDLDDSVRDKLRATHQRLGGVTEIALTEAVFRRVQLHRNISHYRLLIEVCKLLYRMSLVDERAGEECFRGFIEETHRMRMLFEKFVLNFMKVEMRGRFKASRSAMRWFPLEGSPEDLKLVPRLVTDITLYSRKRIVVIETKFVSTPFRTHMDRQTLDGGYLRQIFAYMRNISNYDKRNREISGILLYPFARERLDLRVTLHGHPLRVYTLDLSKEWPEVRAQLLQLVD